MKDRHSTTSQLDLSRRDMLKSIAATGALALGGTFGLNRLANAAASSTVRAYGVTTAQLGNKVDLFIFEGGTQNILGPQGAYLVIDEKNPELKLWQRTPDTWKRSQTVLGSDGKQYGVPVIGNADSFGY